MDDKIEGYLKILYPEYEKLLEKENSKFNRKKEFVTENIEEIDKHYKECIKEENLEANNESLLEQDETQKIGDNTNEENEQQENDNIDNVKEVNNEELENNVNFKNKEILENIIKEIKIDKYFSMLYPEYNSLKEEEKYYVLDDKEIIRENIDAIDAYYLDCKAPGSGAVSFEWTDKIIIETAIKLFNRQEKIFTPNDIEQFSSSVKYEEFKRAITTIKEIAIEEQENSNTTE